MMILLVLVISTLVVVYMAEVIKEKNDDIKALEYSVDYLVKALKNK